MEPLLGISEVKRGGIEARMKNGDTFGERVKESEARPPSSIIGFCEEFGIRVKDLS